MAQACCKAMTRQVRGMKKEFKQAIHFLRNFMFKWVTMIVVTFFAFVVGLVRASNSAADSKWSISFAIVLLALVWLLPVFMIFRRACTGTFAVGHGGIPILRSEVLAVGAAISCVLLFVWFWLLGLFAAISCPAGLHQPGDWICSPALFHFSGWSFVVFAALLLYGHFVEMRWLATRTIQLNRASHGPSVPPVRLAVLSDIHAPANSTTTKPYCNVTEAVNATNPDVVVLLGDMLASPEGVDGLHAILRNIRAPHKFAVRGNWDLWYWRDQPLLHDTGFEWLDGSTRVIQVRGRNVLFSGLPYLTAPLSTATERAHALESHADELCEDIDEEEPWRVFLYHSPDLALSVRANLFLSGHTHGGQIAVPFYGALITLSAVGKRFERGLVEVERGERWAYTTTGVGVEPAFPLRLGVRPEVVLFELGN